MPDGGPRGPAHAVGPDHSTRPPMQQTTEVDEGDVPFDQVIQPGKIRFKGRIRQTPEAPRIHVPNPHHRRKPAASSCSRSRMPRTVGRVVKVHV